MRLIVGLGNPGREYRDTRHNVGFMVADELARRQAVTFGAAPAQVPDTLQVKAFGPPAVLLAKPLTYMNASGESVQAAAAFYKLLPDAITAFHDELDLVPGKVRVKKGGGAAGHNGLRSMDRHLGTPDYWRVRLGIGHPGDKARVTGHVLGDFAKVDQPWLLDLLDAVAGAAPLLAGDKPEDFMTRVALLTQETK